MLFNITDLYPDIITERSKDRTMTISRFDWRNFFNSLKDFENRILSNIPKEDKDLKITGISKCGFLSIVLSSIISKRRKDLNVHCFVFSPLVKIDLDDEFFNNNIAKWLRSRVGHDRKRIIQKYGDARKLIPQTKIKNLQIDAFYVDTDKMDYDRKQVNLIRDNPNVKIFKMTEDQCNQHFDMSKEDVFEYHRKCLPLSFLIYDSHLKQL